MLFTGRLLCMAWIKTWSAQKVLVWVKFTGNLYSYVCERLPLKYTQTRICRNSDTETRTVPESYSCLCERILRCSPSASDSTLVFPHSVVWFVRQMPFGGGPISSMLALGKYKWRGWVDLLQLFCLVSNYSGPCCNLVQVSVPSDLLPVRKLVQRWSIEHFQVPVGLSQLFAN